MFSNRLLSPRGSFFSNFQNKKKIIFDNVNTKKSSLKHGQNDKAVRGVLFVGVLSICTVATLLKKEARLHFLEATL